MTSGPVPSDERAQRFLELQEAVLAGGGGRCTRVQDQLVGADLPRRRDVAANLVEAAGEVGASGYSTRSATQTVW